MSDYPHWLCEAFVGHVISSSRHDGIWEVAITDAGSLYLCRRIDRGANHKERTVGERIDEDVPIRIVWDECE